MHNNIFVNCLFAALFACLTVSCGSKIDPDNPPARFISLPGNGGDKTYLTLICNSNLDEFIKVNYELLGADQIRTSGYFTKSDTTTFYWTADSSAVRLAFKAEKVHSFSVILFDRPEGVTFNVRAILTTPTDGVEVNWCGLDGAVYKYSESLTLWTDTLTALNSGLSGQMPGTGNTRYLRFGIAPNSFGKYGITLDWIAGDLFDKSQKNIK